ncbi:MAG TPA: glucose 1-dehydrogenase [Thermodesulfobacteriota bacterium]|nr:glucose 1-dehydrogenase [Thermodesulfobacteriota bacterium]
MTDYVHLFNLTGRAAVVTGASGGIGKAIALALAAHGANVLAAGRNPEKTKQAAAEVAASGRRAVPFILEITSRKSAEEMAAAATAEFGRIDILVNSAGMNIRNEILSIGDADWDAVLTTNLKGVLYCCQAVGKRMIERSYGKIINISSISSFLGHPARGAYAASKGGLIQLTRVMATEWAPHHIMVNAISPAAVDTPFIDGLKKDRYRLDRELERIPMARIATPEDVAGAAVFLASGASDFITGQNLFIDGGRTVD